LSSAAQGVHEQVQQPPAAGDVRLDRETIDTLDSLYETLDTLDGVQDSSRTRPGLV
jgi:hypothetical protein